MYFPKFSHELDAKAYILRWFRLASASTLQTESGVKGNESHSLCLDLQPPAVEHQEVHHYLLYLPAVENRLIRLHFISALPILIATAKDLQARRACSSR